MTNARTQPTIVLTGFMGAGKTTVAAALSRRLGCAMADLDSLIAKREGRAPQAIIEEHGEGRFRELESEALRSLLEEAGRARVVALGGGTWTVARNRALIGEHHGFTVWLDAPFELCWRRILGEGGSRPLGRDYDTARALYDGRRAIYDEAALRIEVSEVKTAEALAAEIAEALSRFTEEGFRAGANSHDPRGRNKGEG
jgi:shikimate kinase